MFISKKKEYLLTDSVFIAGLNKKRVKTTETQWHWSFEYWFGTCCVNIALFYEAVLGNEDTNSRIRQLKKIGPPQNRPTAIRPFFLDSTRS